MLCEPSFYSDEDEGWEQVARPLAESGSWSVRGCYEFQLIQRAK